jgi:transmembrane sensor
VLQFSRHTRALELTRGRAHFDVAHDPARPFSVKVGNETVLDIGTAFNVERLHSKVLITLMQGRVAVQSNPTETVADSKTFLLTPGQELVVNRAGRSAITQANLQAANAWEHGQIVFTAEPLGEAAERLNRYLSTPLKVDPEIAKTKINGVFTVSKLDAFVGAVTSYFPIQSKRENGFIVLEKRV